MTTPTRRFTLIDLLSLVTAIAIAFAVCHYEFRLWDSFGVDWNPVNRLSLAYGYAGTTLTVITFYLGIATVYHRRTRESILRCPGGVCMLSICGAAVIVMLSSWDNLFGETFSLSQTLAILPLSIHGSPLVAACTGITILAALKITSVPRDAPDWIDRAGKLTVFLWLTIGFVKPVMDVHVLRALGIPFE